MSRGLLRSCPSPRDGGIPPSRGSSGTCSRREFVGSRVKLSGLDGEVWPGGRRDVVNGARTGKWRDGVLHPPALSRILAGSQWSGGEGGVEKRPPCLHEPPTTDHEMDLTRPGRWDPPGWRGPSGPL